MRSVPELPLFLQTTIAIFGFLFLIAMISPFASTRSEATTVIPAVVKYEQL